jgi:hypothetical protein
LSVSVYQQFDPRSVDLSNITESDLKQYNKEKLKAIAKANGVRVGGNRAAIIANILLKFGTPASDIAPTVPEQGGGGNNGPGVNDEETPLQALRRVLQSDELRKNLQRHNARSHLGNELTTQAHIVTFLNDSPIQAQYEFTFTTQAHMGLGIHKIDILAVSDTHGTHKIGIELKYLNSNAANGIMNNAVGQLTGYINSPQVTHILFLVVSVHGDWVTDEVVHNTAVGAQAAARAIRPDITTPCEDIRIKVGYQG